MISTPATMLYEDVHQCCRTTVGVRTNTGRCTITLTTFYKKSIVDFLTIKNVFSEK